MSNGVAGGNIALAAGRPVKAGTPWSSAVVQSAIGGYVQDADRPTADTNYVGINTLVAYKINVMQEGVNSGAYVVSAPYQGLTTGQVDFTANVDDNAATGGLAQWVKAAGVISPGTNGGRCNIVAGVATANATGTHVCRVVGGVVADDYFWATVFA